MLPMHHPSSAVSWSLGAGSPGFPPAHTTLVRFCAVGHPGGGGGLTQAERKKLALTHKKADQAIAAASRAVNMPAPVA